MTTCSQQPHASSIRSPDYVVPRPDERPPSATTVIVIAGADSVVRQLHGVVGRTVPARGVGLLAGFSVRRSKNSRPLSGVEGSGRSAGGSCRPRQSTLDVVRTAASGSEGTPHRPCRRRTEGTAGRASGRRGSILLPPEKRLPPPLFAMVRNLYTVEGVLDRTCSAARLLRLPAPRFLVYHHLLLSGVPWQGFRLNLLSTREPAVTCRW